MKLLLSTFALFLIHSLVSGQTPSENYIKTTTYKVETTSSISSPLPSQATINITYIDGLGKAKQTIAYRQAGDGNDLVTHISYDGLGRQFKEYLPYKKNASLNFDSTAESNTLSFYNTSEYGNTTNPFSEVEFEVSPLGRILRQAAPGNDWSMNNDHEIRFSYETNPVNDVYHFTVNLGGANPVLEYGGYYPVGQLYKTVTKDENWETSDGTKGTVVEYKDKMGRLVLKRVIDIYSGNRSSGTNAINLDTYYVYDDYGNLSFVLSPKLSVQIISGGTLVGNANYLIEELGYQYRYDFRNRLTEKKLPGKHWEYLVYDPINRLVATGPVLSPFGDNTEGWLHTKYDKFHRVVYTLWKEGEVTPFTRQSVQAQYLTNPISERRKTGTTTVNGVSFSYTNLVQPTSGYHVLTVSYYDDYEYTGAPSSIPSTVGDGDSNVYYNNGTLKPKGLSTGSWTREVETSSQTNGTKSYVLFDKNSLPVRTNATYGSGGYTQIDSKFNFIGNVLYTNTSHKKNTSGSVLSLKDVYTYDNQERLSLHKHKIGSQAYQLMNLNEYDDLGRLIRKSVGGTDLSGTNAFQKVDYLYNVRGWMTDINKVSYLQIGNDPVDLFAFKINYNLVLDNINGEVLPQYNGNISETFWRTSSDNILRKYGYSFDYQNRLMDSWYQLPGSTVPHNFSYNENLTYDRNGNILTLVRNGEQESETSVLAIDDLMYTYDDGNKLVNVTDVEAHPSGFNDGYTGTSDDFEYDSYGNMVLDRNKNITDITYNHLNLPVEITFGTSGNIQYLYDAIGVKRKKTVTEGAVVKETLYLDGFQYSGTALDHFPTSEGYVKFVNSFIGGTYNYVFNYIDHLGNIRLRYAKKPSTGEIVILEEDHYYPFGLKQQGYNSDVSDFKKDDDTGTIDLTEVDPFLGTTYQYKFGGKEYQPELGLETYDFGARNYMPDLGRWANIDPLAEMSISYTPFNYVQNTPIMAIDPNGLSCVGCPDNSSINLSDMLDIGSCHCSDGGGGNDPPAINEGNPIQLNEVVITAKGSGSSGLSSNGFDYSGMPDYMRMDNSSWTSSTSLKNLGTYNAFYGTDFGSHNPGTTFSQWQYRFFYKRQYDNMISSMHAATSEAAEYVSYILPTPLVGANLAFKGLPALSKGLGVGYKYADDALQLTQLAGNIRIHRYKGFAINKSYNLYKSAPRFLRRGLYPMQKGLNREQNIFRYYLSPQTPSQINSLYTNGKYINEIIRKFF